MEANRLAAVGAFVLGGILLFAVGLFLIGDRRMLFGETFRVYAEFENIAALSNGAKVRVAGMDAGEVETISVPGGPAERFRVRMRIRGDLRPLIRLDSVASIQTDGLVGNKFVQIEAGSEDAPMVVENDTIQSQEPFDFGDLVQRMSETVDIVNETILNLRGDVDDALQAFVDTAQLAQEVITEVGGDARTIMASANEITDDLETIIAAVRDGRGTVGQLLTDDALYRHARRIAEEAEQIMANVRQASEDAREAIADLRGENGPMKGVTGDLQHTLGAARQAMTNLAENTEALKHNFFFRGYFNRRGYFDLDRVSVQEYREGALATAGRRPLRIWLGTDVLFERDDTGQERLSPGGMTRLDSAMSVFVKYPRTSPFVVEGYTRALTADERHLTSLSRARLVKDYLIAKFELDPAYVTTMPMGSEADQSPAGATWDGVALAMFVQG